LFLDMLWRETESDIALRHRAFAGLRRYQEATRPAPPPQPHVASVVGSARLLHYGTEKAAKNGKAKRSRSRAPVLFIPSLINPPTVLDLSENQSLLRYLASRGHDPWMVDWGTPGQADLALDLADHVEHRLAPLIAALPQPPILAGYCLGGTLALGAASIVPVRAVTAIATPWDFTGFHEAARQEVTRLWSGAKPICARLGYVPMEVLQSGFWALDPARTIRKYAAFGEMEPGSDGERAFLALEDWANAGPPLTFAAAEDLFDRLYSENRTGEGRWMVKGAPVTLSALGCPSLAIRSSTDRIVPAASAPTLAEQMTLELGHVGMIVGRRAPDALWNPLSDWLSSNGA
jgi:polyhydroxyalkanoate synthase